MLDEETPAPRYPYQEPLERQDVRPIGPRELLNLLRRRFVSIATVLAVGTGLSLVAANEIPRVYTARSMIVLEPDDPNLLGDTPQQQVDQTIQSKIDTEADLMTSRNFAGRVVDSLNLIAEPDFNTFLQGPGMGLGEEQGQSGGPLLSYFRTVKSLFSTTEAADPALPPSAIQRDRAISSYLSRLSHTQNGESLAMTVALTDDTPQMAATLANATTRIFIEWSRDLKRERTRDAVEFLRQQAGELASRIAKLEGEIAEYGRTNKVSSDPRDDLLRAAMQQANEQLSLARGDFTQAQARLEQVKRVAVNGTLGVTPGELAGTEPLLSSDFLTSLRNDEAVALRDRAQLARNYGANHPLIKEADAKIKSVRTLLSEEMGRIIANLENDVRVARGRVEQFEQDLAASEKDLRQRSLAEIRLRELNRDLLTEQKLYDVVAARLGKLDPYAEVAEPGSRVVSYAAVPEEPSFPRVHVIAMGGFMGSLVLALIIAFVLESLDTRVREPRRVSQLLGLPLLASIPALPRGFLRGRPQAVHQLLRYPRSTFAEAFRALYSACRRFSGGSRKQAILVGSALPKEGKTTTAIGLAVAAALDGARTALVDLDLRAGRVQAALQLRGAGRTLDEYLQGDCSIHDILESAPQVPRLDVLATSMDRTDVDRVLNTDELERLINALKLKYDVVIVNAPPVLVVEDAVRIAGLVDGVVLVAALNRTKEGALQHAAERLHLAGAPLIGVTLSEVDLSFQENPAYAGSQSNPRLASPKWGWLFGGAAHNLAASAQTMREQREGAVPKVEVIARIDAEAPANR
ncbi:GumC family protein [Allomesorhizobium camelthorni]|uniref:AAA family ATPase n=1 Tax=Allomesorhizobium camelthorni TaxID=475069 RepID=A0A6G4WEF4_9HYPH|nr:AAA family ATPase [Mesorhizobium camelthorni]NGO53172.1 AAA family ATPase [Mesorhizobium camelthorni]